jgi:hypothetical protein
MTRFLASVCAALLGFTGTLIVRADVVTDWNRTMSSLILSTKTSNLVTTRVTAIVHSAVFDAVNGIERRYTSIHVAPNAPRGASQRAAAIQAAYATLVNLYPTQKADLDAARTASLAGITNDGDFEDSQSIARGIGWGQTVADSILAWRSTDGASLVLPPYTGGTDPGQWRPTPPAFLPGAGPQFATVTPWALTTPSQFRPDGPQILGSDTYEADLNETRNLGSLASTLRSAYATETAKFWNGNTTLFWNRIALTMADRRDTSLSENARLFALLNIAIADAGIACWDAKYFYSFWRPVTAIRLDATAPDPSWTPLLITPNFPEYPSAHATVSPAGAVVLQSFFGDSGTYTLDSDVLPGVLHTFDSFAAAADEAFLARIYGGIHFRSSCRDGHTLGVEVGVYVLQNVAVRN